MSYGVSVHQDSEVPTGNVALPLKIFRGSVIPMNGAELEKSFAICEFQGVPRTQSLSKVV
jgi:hypothetical protein